MTPLPALPSHPDTHYLQPGFSTSMPKGMKKEQEHLARMCREWAPEVVATLAYWLLSGDSSASLTAGRLLLDRGFGKSKEVIELTTPGAETQHLTVEEKAAALMAAMQEGRTVLRIAEPGDPVELEMLS